MDCKTLDLSLKNDKDGDNHPCNSIDIAAECGGNNAGPSARTNGPWITPYSYFDGDPEENKKLLQEYWTFLLNRVASSKSSMSRETTARPRGGKHVWSTNSFTAKQKLAAIKRVHDGMSKVAVARDINVPESTLRGWCKAEHKLRMQTSKTRLVANNRATLRTTMAQDDEDDDSGGPGVTDGAQHGSGPSTSGMAP